MLQLSLMGFLTGWCNLKYISREPDIDGNVVPVDNTDGATVAVVGVIHQDVDPELGEVPDLEERRGL